MEIDFLNNEIYKYLVKKNSTEFVYMIDQTYKYCDDILKEIPKEFSNYTLHDIAHAIRVINYMTYFVKDNIEEYTDLHLALIIVSGLLHDTGMFVSDDEKDSIITRLVDEDNNTNLQDLFQNYIREHHSERVRKILDTYITKENNTLSSLFSIGKSYNISDVIALICESHTNSCDWINKNIKANAYCAHYAFNPQHVALLLRIGDNLDIDDRRAPAYLAELLKVRGYSLEEWTKHIQITNYDKIRKDREGVFNVFFSGQCDDSNIYRKVLEHISWVENDYACVNSITETYDDMYKFTINPKIQNSIETKGFEATSLQFSLDYEKVVKLLMGENIYGDKRMGLRELLQNSIDAVMVMKEKIKNDVVSSYVPTICIELNKNADKVIIHDNGIGMSEEVLSKYFFNIGCSYYSSKDFLKNHYDYYAIGHYGIGFLACFMLSQNVVMETQAQGNEIILIEFEKTSRYITKRKAENGFPEGHGTRISLDYNEVLNVFGNEKSLIKYVEDLLLTDGYCLRIIGENGKTIINNTLSSKSDIYERKISTNDFDIIYCLENPPRIISLCQNLINLARADLYIPIDDSEYYDIIEYAHFAAVREEFEEIDMKITHEKKYLKNMSYLELFEKYMQEKDDRLNIIYLGHGHCYREDVKVIDALSNDLVKSIYNKGYLEWWKIPFMIDQESLTAFEKWRSEYGYKSALETYKESIRCYHIFGSKLPNPIQLAEITNNIVEAYDGTAEYDEDSYSESFTFMPIRVKKRALQIKNETAYMIIGKENNVDNNKLKINSSKKEIENNRRIFMHGIWVNEENFAFPCMIRGTKFKRVVVNVKTNKYQLNVSRTRFDENSQKKLYRDIEKEIFRDIANNPKNNYNNNVKDTIMKFVEEYI